MRPPGFRRVAVARLAAVAVSVKREGYRSGRRNRWPKRAGKRNRLLPMERMNGRTPFSTPLATGGEICSHDFGFLCNIQDS